MGLLSLKEDLWGSCFRPGDAWAAPPWQENHRELPKGEEAIMKGGPQPHLERKQPSQSCNGARPAWGRCDQRK